MKHIIRITKKELLDTLRDKRTLMRMIIIPVMIFPIIMVIFTSVSQSFAEEAMTKELKVGVTENIKETALYPILSNPIMKFELIEYADTTDFRSDLRSDDIDFGIGLPPSFVADFSNKKSPDIFLFHESTEDDVSPRIKVVKSMMDSILTKERLGQLELTSEQYKPYTYKEVDASTDIESLGKYAGGILPYFFIAFCFVGCMYPAIDLFTGEKERGTIETILTTPVSRSHILLGKLAVVVMSGLLAATLTLCGLFLSLQFIDVIPDDVMGVINSILNAKFILLTYAMLIPLAIFFAGIMTPITVYSKSFKEAQSIITPLNIVVVLPAMVGFFPGIELNVVTAFIPVVNIVLATKDIIAGTIDMGLLSIVVASLVLLAGAAVAVSVRQFGKESNILR